MTAEQQRKEAAREIRDQLGELVRKARAARPDTLAYVLEMAIMQANEAGGLSRQASRARSFADR